MKEQIFYLVIIISMIILIFILFLCYKIYKMKYPLPLVHYALYEYMKDLHKICQENNITYWVDSGTLLGLIRDNGIIPHDDDIDICMYEKDLKSLMHIVNSDPNQKYHIFLLSTTPIYKFQHKNIPDIFIDIFVIDEYGDKIQYKETFNKFLWPNSYYYKTELFPLKKVLFFNQEVIAPNNPIPYLERAYGNWKIPVDYGRHIF